MLRCMCFRPQLRTAPLKLRRRQFLQILARLFPSSTEDGSIEASLLNCWWRVRARVSVLN